MAGFRMRMNTEAEGLAAQASGSAMANARRNRHGGQQQRYEQVDNVKMPSIGDEYMAKRTGAATLDSAEVISNATDDGKNVPDSSSIDLDYTQDPDFAEAEGHYKRLGSMIMSGDNRPEVVAAFNVAQNVMANRKQAIIDRFRSSSPETFDLDKPLGQRWTENGLQQEYLGTQGTVRGVPVAPKTFAAVDQYGRKQTFEEGRPGARYMVTKPGEAVSSETKYLGDSSAPPDIGPFAGGIARAEAPMEELVDAKFLADLGKTKSETKENEAQAFRLRNPVPAQPTSGSKVSPNTLLNIFHSREMQDYYLNGGSLPTDEELQVAVEAANAGQYPGAIIRKNIRRDLGVEPANYVEVNNRSPRSNVRDAWGLTEPQPSPAMAAAGTPAKSAGPGYKHTDGIVYQEGETFFDTKRGGLMRIVDGKPVSVSLANRSR